jgi:hypothetical protein
VKMTRLGPGVGREAVMRVVGRLTEAVTILPTSVIAYWMHFEFVSLMLRESTNRH